MAKQVTDERRFWMKGEDLESLLVEVLAAYEDEYSELLSQFVNLDRKAGVFSGISGLFLASIFAFARQSRAEIPNVAYYALVASLALLILAVTTCALASRLRSRVDRPGGSMLWKMVKDLEMSSVTEDRIRRYRIDQITCWESTIASLRDSFSKKALLIRVAEILVLVAIVTMAVAIGSTLAR